MSIPSSKILLHQALKHSRTPSTTTQAISSPPPAYTYYPSVPQLAAQIDEEHPDSDMDSTPSPIIISISSPVTIIGHTNLLAIDPTEMGTNIAQSIVRSIKEASVCSAGIPMFDEEGRPRPIEIRVDAGIKVQGTNNTVGEKAVLFGLQAAADLKRTRESTEDNQLEAAGDGSELKETDCAGKRQKIA
jgi:hypothetical protein